ncbi:MAG: hypothetical protein CMH57_03740 [Myxococcales bacterium]|nr:hypothetical protein [Myxococcales bacterium]
MKSIAFRLSTGSRPGALIPVSLVALGLAAGCGPGGKPVELEVPADWASGPDKLRDGANEITLDTTVVDNVSIDRGDRTDWKYFTVPASGVISVTVTFDNSDALGQMMVTDDVGQIIATFVDERRRMLDRVTFKADPGRYYVQIWVEELDSDYSLQADYAPLLPGD